MRPTFQVRALMRCTSRLTRSAVSGASGTPFRRRSGRKLLDDDFSEMYARPRETSGRDAPTSPSAFCVSYFIFKESIRCELEKAIHDQLRHS
jgi:hypothetical protein